MHEVADAGECNDEHSEYDDVEAAEEVDFVASLTQDADF